MLFVMNQRKTFGVVKRRVADFVFVDAKIVMQENANFSFRIAQISARASRRRKMFSWLATVSLQTISMPSFSLVNLTFGNKRFGQITKLALPIVSENPRKFAVRPHAESKRKTFRVIFLPDVRKINVADLIFVVKIYEQRAVANRNVTHKTFFTKVGAILSR